MTARIRVLVVDDSALIRQILTRALSEDPHIEIVGTARDGVEALQKAAELKPDVLTLDIEMPELDGIQVLRHLRRYSDARVVVLSSVDDAATTFLALSLGAVEFIAKPTAGVATSIAELSETLRLKIRTAFHVAPEHAVALAKHPRTVATIEPAVAPGPAGAAESSDPAGESLVCVGIAASTGGPPAIEIVLSGMPTAVPAAFLIVQHLPPGFSASFARRLTNRGGIPVIEAQPGEPVLAGRGYVAPHGTHLVVEADPDGVVRFVALDEPPLHGVRPAADPLFRSIAEQFGPRSIGVVLTGMGVDGAAGAAAIAQAGGEIFVQDEATSVVWGMPRAVERAGVPCTSLPLAEIAEKVRASVRSRADQVRV